MATDLLSVREGKMEKGKKGEWQLLLFYSFSFFPFSPSPSSHKNWLHSAKPL
jgi:hypothetical protein